MTSDSSEGDNYSNLNHENYQIQFISLLRRNQILLNKSQLPKIKCLKEKALEHMINHYNITFGKAITSKQIQKKINNMKTEVKRKTDKNATGNKKIKLKTWESELLDMLNAETNPVFNSIPGLLLL